MSEQRFGKHYVFDDNPDVIERKRLEMLERMQDPGTRRHLEGIQVGKGWRCLDIGAGLGSLALWLSERVGPEGKVVATDINTRFLSTLNVPNLKIRQHDILKDDLEADHYDLVHCRAVLMHLAKPDQALKRMVKAVRSGGWILIEEADYSSFSAVDPKYSGAKNFDSLHRYMFDAATSIGLSDNYIGRHVRGRIKELGLVDIHHEGRVLIHQGGEDSARFSQTILDVAKPNLLSFGICTEAEFEQTRHLYEDPSFAFIGATLFSAWGQKPKYDE